MYLNDIINYTTERGIAFDNESSVSLYVCMLTSIFIFYFYLLNIIKLISFRYYILLYYTNIKHYLILLLHLHYTTIRYIL